MVRIRELETELDTLRRRFEELRAQTAFQDTFIDDVLMPAVLLLAGQGYRNQLRAFLEQARADTIEADAPQVSRDYEAKRLDDWLRAVRAMPTWLPLRHERRNRDD